MNFTWKKKKLKDLLLHLKYSSNKHFSISLVFQILKYLQILMAKSISTGTKLEYAIPKNS